MENIVAKLRHPKEKFYGACLYIFGAVVWVFIVGVIAFALAKNPTIAIVLTAEIMVFIAIAFLIAALYRAYIFGHYVLLGPDQLPHLYKMVEEGAARLNLAKTPRTFVYNSNGLINAFAIRLVGSPYVMLTSSLIDADTDAQVRFVIGHELGHHAAGHLNFWKILLKAPGHIVPLLGPAYSRARELTCDRVGAYLANDREAARGALAMLACGSSRLNASLNRDAFEAQEQMVPPFFGFLHKIFSRYPRLTTRVKQVDHVFTNLAS